MMIGRIIKTLGQGIKTPTLLFDVSGKYSMDMSHAVHMGTKQNVPMGTDPPNKMVLISIRVEMNSEYGCNPRKYFRDDDSFLF
jgi:hypothetical protein